MRTASEQRRERQRTDADVDEPGPSYETYDETLERWRDDWREEIDRNLEDGR